MGVKTGPDAPGWGYGATKIFRKTCYRVSRSFVAEAKKSYLSLFVGIHFLPKRAINVGICGAKKTAKMVQDWANPGNFRDFRGFSGILEIFGELRGNLKTHPKKFFGDFWGISGNFGSLVLAHDRRQKKCKKTSGKSHMFLLKLLQMHPKDENLRECCKMPERVGIRHYKKLHKTTQAQRIKPTAVARKDPKKACKAAQRTVYHDNLSINKRSRGAFSALHLFVSSAEIDG